MITWKRRREVVWCIPSNFEYNFVISVLRNACTRRIYYIFSDIEEGEPIISIDPIRSDAWLSNSIHQTLNKKENDSLNLTIAQQRRIRSFKTWSNDEKNLEPSSAHLVGGVIRKGRRASLSFVHTESFSPPCRNNKRRSGVKIEKERVNE